jgi:hypothetical protein
MRQRKWKMSGSPSMPGQRFAKIKSATTCRER